MNQHSDQIDRAIRETSDLMRDYSLSLSDRYAATGADRLAIAREFAAIHGNIDDESQSIALMTIRVAVLERNIKTSTSIERRDQSGIK